MRTVLSGLYDLLMNSGFRPELQRDVQQLRETIWQEVKRLLQKKRAGRLVVALDSPDHVHEL